MWGWHANYRRLVPARRIARVVAVSDQAVLVADWVEGPPGSGFALSIPLAPDVQWEQGLLTLPDGRLMGLWLPGEPTVHSGEEGPLDGWWSPTYGCLRPATRLEVEGSVAGPVCWELGSADAPTWRDDGDSVLTDGARIGVRWSGNLVMLELDQGGKSEVTALDSGSGVRQQSPKATASLRTR